ncbi:hypothetical protein GT037_001675 [Alternaria burnsii]|uniref:Uncharacterized protein n=1 Tax=Alternaria burnsii TaxID=1187904 RepID=A0A8H7B9B9_9PLEO|nr:uncharacterized protein GT037_001675 [Alternaria burnsii]KAF7680024.1 hypothetical protein GT037_001675 [Alternaria burnsii]
MKFSASILSTAVVLSSTVSAQSPAVTSTLTVHPGCPSAAPADVMVTRSAVAVPSCAAGSNETKPSIIMMSGSGMMGSATASGNMPEFTGAAAANMAMGSVVVGVFGGLFAALMV